MKLINDLHSEIHQFIRQKVDDLPVVEYFDLDDERRLRCPECGTLGGGVGDAPWRMHDLGMRQEFEIGAGLTGSNRGWDSVLETEAASVLVCPFGHAMQSAPESEITWA